MHHWSSSSYPGLYRPGMCVLILIHILNVILRAQGLVGQARGGNGPRGAFSASGSNISKMFFLSPTPRVLRSDKLGRIHDT